MPLSKLQQISALGSVFIVTVALAEAIHQAGGTPVFFILAPPIIALLTAFFIFNKVGTRTEAHSTNEQFSSDRIYMATAWLCVFFGIILMITESLMSYLWCDFSLQMEDILLALGAMWALAEEVRLYRARRE